MAKTIQLSNANYGLLWSQALETDRNEDDIVGRLLKEAFVKSLGRLRDELEVELSGREDHEVEQREDGGFTDPRFMVHFPEMTRIWRSYKGERYEAVVERGVWHLNGNEYGTLNQLNKAVGAHTENVWVSWYIGQGKDAKRLTELRDQDKIVRRNNSGDQG